MFHTPSSVGASVLNGCRLCPRQCGVDRAADVRGFCGAGMAPRIYRYGLHDGEEPPVSGTRGSGTVFFSHCTMRCIYCQNHPWSQGDRGTDYTVTGLADILRGLHAQGCHNWNLVSPTPWLPQIHEALALLRDDGVSLPVVYNTSSFDRPDVLAEYSDDVDIYLADLRYATTSAAEAGSACPGYPEAARAAVQEMWRQKGPLVLDAHGQAVRGVIVRLLVLPGRADEAIKNLHWLADAFGTDLTLSLMSQYLPAFEAGTAPWNRRVRADEYGPVCAALEMLGFERGWVQELEEEPAEHLVGYQMSPDGETAIECACPTQAQLRR